MPPLFLIDKALKIMYRTHRTLTISLMIFDINIAVLIGNGLTIKLEQNTWSHASPIARRKSVVLSKNPS